MSKKETITLDTPSENYLAALDIGSNSFHFVLARRLGEHIQIVHAEKYRAQLAQGLSSDFILSTEAIERGVKILANLAETTKQLSKDNFRVVATYTLRQAKNVESFLKAAAKVFPFDIEIVSGHEEARLIYQGVNHYYTPSSDHRMVVDIGGGSTECIIGKKKKITNLASINIGCVSHTKHYFNDGKISQKGFDKAIRAARHEFDALVKRFKSQNYKQVLGTSGTFKSIHRVVNAQEHLAQAITLADLYKLKRTLIHCAHVKDLTIDGLKASRQEVFPAGVAIIIALMETFEITAINYCQYALREGVLTEQLDNISHNNVRKRTIESLCERFNVDTLHVDNVLNQAMHLFDKVQETWALSSKIYKELLHAAILLHELGLDINSSAYQKHGQYIIENADLPGFNQEQQQALAWLVGNQRKKITPLETNQWHLLKPQKLTKLCAILRLSILLTQQRHTQSCDHINADAEHVTLTLTIEQQWLADRPIVDNELAYEKAHLQRLGILLLVNPANEC